MYTSPVLSIFLSAACHAKKAKADRIVVLCRSVVSRHTRLKARQRLSDKLEFIDIDPIVGQEVIYKEEKKIRSIREHQIQAVPRLLYTNQIESKWRSIAPEPS